MGRDISQLLSADETVVLETRQHWWVLVRSVAIFILGIAFAGVLIGYSGNADWLDNSGGDWLAKLLWVVLAVLVLVAGWRALGWFTERLYVTTSKVVYARGILNRNVTSTALVKIDEMTLVRPLLGRMLGFGRLEVENASGGREPLAGLEYLPKPNQLYQMIGERARNQRMIEGGAHRDANADGLVDDEPAMPPQQRTSSEADALSEGLGTWKPTGDATSGDE